MHQAVAFTHPGDRVVICRVYAAVRYAWDPEKAQAADIVLAVERGLIIGAFVVDKWLEATPGNSPVRLNRGAGAGCCIGKEAPKDVAAQYLGHRLPDSMRKRGAANPIRYV